MVQVILIMGYLCEILPIASQNGSFYMVAHAQECKPF
jgi:hypothetical protein